MVWHTPILAMEATDKLPVLISPNAPPIPFETFEWTWKGQYVDMVELLPEARTKFQNEKDKKNRYKGEVKSVFAWTEYFLAYIAIVAKQNSDRVPDLLAYASLIISAARRFKGNGWQVYDAKFHSQAAANSLTVWAQTNSSLWTTVFSTAEAFNHCTRCLSVDHLSEECHKNSRSNKFPDEDAGPTTSRTQARHGVQPICKSWNYSHCVSATCAYRHVCLECRENHHIVQCPTNRHFQPYPKAKPGEEGRGMARRQAFRGQRDFNPR